MSEYQYSRHSKDLSSARNEESPELLASGVCELTVEELDDEAYLHFGGQSADPVRAFEGMSVSVAAALGSELGDVYLSNPAGEGSIRITARNGLCVAYGSGSKGGSDAFAPTELGLTGSFSDGDEETATVDVTGVRRLDVRALVSGIGSLSELSAPNILTNTQDESIRVDPDNDRVFVGNDSGEVYEIDVSDPENPVVAAGPLSPAGMVNSVFLYYDADNQKLLAYSDNDSTDLLVFGFDASTVGALSFESSVSFSSGNVARASQAPERLGSGVDQQEWLLVNDGTEGAFVIDYSDITSLAVADSHTNSPISASPIFDPETEHAYLVETSSFADDSDVRVYSVNLDSGSIFFLRDLSIPEPSNVDGFFSSGLIEFDAERSLTILSGNPNTTVLYRITPNAVELVDSVQDSGFGEYRHIAIDADRQRFLGADRNNNGIGVGSYSTSALDLGRTFSPSNLSGVVGPPWRYGRDDHYLWGAQDDAFGAVEYDRGIDRLVVEPLDPAGNPIADLVVRATLKEGIEALVSLRTVGVGQVDVTHKAQSGAGGTRDYFDAYREAIG